MFQSFWSCEGTIFGYMPDNNTCNIIVLWIFNNFFSDIFYLWDTSACSRYFLTRKHGYRVPDNNSRIFSFYTCKYIFYDMLGEESNIISSDIEAFCPRLDLPKSFFSADIDNIFSYPVCELETQCRLSDTRFSWEKYHASGNDSSTKHGIKFTWLCDDSRFFSAFETYFLESFFLSFFCSLLFFTFFKLFEGIPLLTEVTLTFPGKGFISTVGADVHSLRLRNIYSVYIETLICKK